MPWLQKSSVGVLHGGNGIVKHAQGFGSRLPSEKSRSGGWQPVKIQCLFLSWLAGTRNTHEHTRQGSNDIGAYSQYKVSIVSHAGIV